VYQTSSPIKKKVDDQRVSYQNTSFILYDETMKMKQVTNQLKEENLKLRTRIQQTTKELEKKERIIQDLMQQSQSESKHLQKYTIDSSIVINLKKKLKEIKERCNSKEEEMRVMKEAIRAGRMKNLEEELSDSIEQCEQLKSNIIQLIKTSPIPASPNKIAALQNKLAEQEEVIKTKRQENFKLANTIQDKDEEIEKSKEFTINLEKKTEKLEAVYRNNIKIKKIVEDIRKEVQKVKDQINALRLDDKEKQLNILKVRANELTKKQVNINCAIRQRDYWIQELEKNAAIPKENLEVKQLKDKITQCTPLSLLVDKIEVRKLENTLNNKPQPKDKSEIALVSEDEIKRYAFELRIALMGNEISMEKLKQVLKYYDKDDSITILELAKLLKRRVKSTKFQVLIKIARYLIEPRNNKTITYKKDIEKNAIQTLETLFKLIGDYELPKDETNLMIVSVRLNV
jgi:hypothetical protein